MYSCQNFCVLLYSRRPVGLNGIYKIDIGVLFHAGKLAVRSAECPTIITITVEKV